MSRAAYERVRKALEGTALDGEIEKLCAELHLTPESPEWTIAALAIIGAQPLSMQLTITKARLEGALQELPDAMRAAGTEIVRGLGADIAAKSVEAIREKTPQDLKQIVSVAAADLKTVSDAHAVALQQRAIAFGNSAQVALDQINSTADAAAQALQSHGRLIYQHHLRGWLQSGLAAIGLAIITAFGSHLFASHQCAANIADAHAYRSLAQLRALERTYCP